MEKEKIVIPNEVFMVQVQMLLNEGHNVKMTARGNSMLPFIRSDKDIIELGNASVIKEGDIVLARLDTGKYVIHRVIRAEGSQLTLMGDGNLYGTESCDSSDVVAKIIGISRGSAYIDCNGAFFKLRSDLWRIAKPIRRVLIGLYKRIRKV